MIPTITHYPPPILQGFSEDMLMTFLQRIQKRVQEKIIPKAIKKIRAQDTGKRKEFDDLLKAFGEIYERKKIEEAEYSAKGKEKIKKRSSFYTAGRTMSFNKLDTEK